MMTVDEFLILPASERKLELVRGELRVTPPAGAPHGVAGANLVIALGTFVKRHTLGRVFGDGVGYELVHIPHTVRMPDASFVRAERLPEAGVQPGLLRFAPDLAVEVLSPSETASSLEEKLHDYTVAGTPLIWVVDPERRTIMTIAADAPVRWLVEGDTLDGGPIIPGFSCAVAEVFDGIARSVTDGRR
jgi:Uma2 family endonuclease